MAALLALAARRAIATSRADTNMIYNDRGLSEEQRMMRDSCRAFVNDFVTPFIRKNWQRDGAWTRTSACRAKFSSRPTRSASARSAYPRNSAARRVDPKTEVQTFAMISEEISRGDAGLSDKLVQIWKVSVLLRNVAPRHLQELWFPRIVEDPTSCSRTA